MNEKEMVNRLRRIRSDISTFYMDGLNENNLNDEQYKRLSFIIDDITRIIWAMEDKALEATEG